MRRLVITVAMSSSVSTAWTPGTIKRGLLVDAADQRVGMRAAHERDVQQAGQRDVVDEAALAAQQRFVLQAIDAGADQRGHERATCSAASPAKAGDPVPTEFRWARGRAYKEGLWLLDARFRGHDTGVTS